MTVIMTSVKSILVCNFEFHSYSKFEAISNSSQPSGAESNKLDASYTQHDIKIIRSH